MANVEEPQFQTLADRIAALNKQKNFQAPEAKAKRPPPPPPPGRPAAEGRSKTVPVISTTSAENTPPQQSPTIPPRPTRTKTTNGAPALPRRTTDTLLHDDAAAVSPAAHTDRIAPPPPISSRNNSNQISPALPPRRPSAYNEPLDGRRKSTASEISQISTVSSMSLNHGASSATSVNSYDGPARKLPPAFDAASLPPLPPTKRELEARAKEAAEAEVASRPPALPSRSNTSVHKVESAPLRPSLPPRLPSRPARSPTTQQDDSPAPAAPSRKLPPPPAAYVKPSSTLNGHSHKNGTPPPLPSLSRDTRDTPPPVPMASRPTMEQIDAANARAAAAAQNSCLFCRDFSGPDKTASQYPRQSLPRSDPIGYLARMLCNPYPSATDKARAAFTWFHFNIDYDAYSFLNDCVKHKTPEETLREGLAVCQGYAEAFQAIVQRAGLECVVVGGHGKGYGYSAPTKGARCPPRERPNHAWNAVRIDGGEWKLIDACWGAGNLSMTTQKWERDLKPMEFTASNETFGLKHYPENPAYFFRADRRTPSWEEYMLGSSGVEPPTMYTNAHGEGIDETSIGPKDKSINVRSGEVVRFQFSYMCPHWNPEKNGKGKSFLYMLDIHGLDGRKDDQIIMETDGIWYWADVRARDLGAPGQTVSVLCVNNFEGGDGRGLTPKQFLAKKSRCNYSWLGVIAWNLV